MKRQSNIELLRIISMIMVMVHHADYYIALPTPESISVHPKIELIRIFVEALSIVAVNVFVLISGWFGIKPRLNRIVSFMFQVAFFAVIGSVVALMLGSPIEGRPVGGWLLLMLGWNYWFVKAYIILYLFSPILNTFIENVSKQQFLNFLLSFYIIQTVYGWYFGDGGYFNRGYSPLSMMGLYLLARYMRLYGSELLKFSWGGYFFLYIVTSMLIAALDLLRIQRGEEWFLMAYSNPLLVLSSLFLFLTFTKIDMRSSRIVNFISASVFAAYLFHMHEDIKHTYWVNVIDRWYAECSFPVLILNTLGWILMFFSAAIVLDLIRRFAWFCLDFLISRYNSVKNSDIF